MWRLTKYISFFVICSISGVNSANEKIEDFIKKPEFRSALNLLEPTNLLKNRATVRTLENYETGENTDCSRNLTSLQEALLNMDLWALKMADASSKVPSGLLQGNIIDLGMYDECIAIKNDTMQIRGKHCMYAIEFSLDEMPVLPINPTLSICLPVSCTVEDIMIVLNSTINSISDSFNYTVRIPSVTCSPVDEKIWDTEFIVCFVILVIYIAFLMICTVCEIVSDRCKDFNKNKVVASFIQFSFKKNAAAIFNMKEKQGNFLAIHGIRAISMAWVVLGHEYSTAQKAPLVNLVDAIDWIKSDDSLYIFTAPFAVDTFFTLSGYLMSYIFLKQMSKQKKFNVPMHYLHRFFRLTPAVIALLIFTIVFLPKIGSGPQWQNFIQLESSNGCREKWWPTLLYLGNFIDKDIPCLGHLWYLNVDMQLFWISPFILYPLYKKPKIGLTFLTSLFLASIVIPAVLININKYRSASYMVDLDKEIATTYFREFYQMTYNRAGPWLVGIYFGYEVARNKRQPKKLTIYAGWLLTFGAFIFCIYGTKYFKEPTYEYDAVVESLFTAFSRPLWGFAICWIVYSSIHNCAGPIGSFLSCKIFLPLSRLSFCIYLVHVLVESTQAAALRTPKYFSDYYTWYYFLSDFAISIAGAICFSLLFEAPILVLEKMIFNRNSADKKLPTKSQNDLSKINTISNEECKGCQN